MDKICPHCQMSCLVPEAVSHLKNWPVLCCHCDDVFIMNDDDDAPSQHQTLSSSYQIKCLTCFHDLRLSHHDAALIASSQIPVSCPRCRQPLPIIFHNRSHQLAAPLFLLFVFALIGLSLWLTQSQTGQIWLSKIQDWLFWRDDTAYRIELLFTDLLAFLKGLFL